MNTKEGSSKKYIFSKGAVLTQDSLDSSNFSATYIGNHKFHILYHNVSYHAVVEKADYENKRFILRIDDQQVSLKVEDSFDLLIEKMGMNVSSSSKVKNLIAPMPGLVLNIMVKQNQEVEIGESLIILEAMKMENVLKSPKSGIIKSITITKGEKVEKGTVLIDFE